MSLRTSLEKLAPDVLETLSRFPFAIALQAVSALILVFVINQGGAVDGEFWFRSALGLSTGAVLAVAGVLYRESRPESRLAAGIFTYGLPLLAIVLLQVRDTTWVTPHWLPAIAGLWLSVSAFTRIGRGAEREAAENRFWWLNHQAVATAVIAAAAFLLISLGMAAIERSLAILFSLNGTPFFYGYVLPLIGAFFTPVYWLSTLPRLEEFDERALNEPDFISRAIGFLGQFVLAPLLLAYAAILLAYTLQIIVAQSLPQGRLGWMVLGFTVTGAATWLVLHPPFMRSRGLVRLFRRWWFWLTVVPLVLYGIAVWIRLDLYGLTTERMLLVAGGLWAAGLTVVFLSGRGDIRLIPALGALVLLVLSVGPHNLQNGPQWNQAVRLEQALHEAGYPLAPGATPNWTDGAQVRAQSALDYLAYSYGRQEIEAVLARNGVTADAEAGTSALREALLMPPLPGTETVRVINVGRVYTSTVDVSATPLLIGSNSIYPGQDAHFGPVSLRIEAAALVATGPGGEQVRHDLRAWVDRQENGEVAEPLISFELAGRAYAVVVDSATVNAPPAEEEGQRELTWLRFNLFTAPAAPL